jgi:heterodisulfide reductase subunit D
LEEARSDDRISRIIKDTHAYLCFDCSKCTGSCPVGRTGTVYSPRSLVQHLMLEGRGPAETDLWRCLTCGLCKERCPQDVDFPEFIHMLREHATARGTLPQPTHGGTIRELMRLMANPELRQARTGWLPDWVGVVPAHGAESAAPAAQSEDLYFVGCSPYFDVIFGDFGLDLKATHTAALELLKARGVTPAVLADERCCGHDALWSGDTELFIKLATRNLELFKAAGARRIFISCPEGYHIFTHAYPKHLGSLDIEFVNTVKFLADELPDAFPAEGGTPVTYLDSCRMGRFAGLYDEPRKIIGLTGGVALREMEFSRENAPCCGSNLWINCDCVSKAMQTSCLKAAEATGAEVLLTACDKCRIHLACAQMENGHMGDGIKTDNILRLIHGKGVKKP